MELLLLVIFPLKAQLSRIQSSVVADFSGFGLSVCAPLVDYVTSGSATASSLIPSEMFFEDILVIVPEYNLSICLSICLVARFIHP